MRISMRGSFGGAFIHQFERLFQQGTTAGLTEGELLERFVRGHDEAAFEALIARHGPMVLSVCRRWLRDPNDVDDAFQATFLVLVRRAGTLQRCDLLGNWLYGVAHRVAMRSRALTARRLARAPHGPAAVDQLSNADGRRAGPESDGPDPEPSPWLHEEVRRLPEKYRTLLVLCYFEGLTHEQAASRLGCPLGTVKGRLARARDLLRRRLTRRGVALSAVALTSYLSLAEARTAIPEGLRSITLRAARAIAGAAGASILPSSSVPCTVATLADGVSRAMITTHLKAASVVLLVAGAVTTGLVIAAAQGPSPADPPDDQPPAAGADAGTAAPAKAKAQSQAQKKAEAARKKEEAHGAQAQAGGGAGMTMGMAGGQAGMGGFGGFGGGMGGFGDPNESDPKTYRLDIAELGAGLTIWDKTPRNESLLKVLDEPLTMSFAKPTSLQQVLKYIKESTARHAQALPIYVDPKGLKDANATLDSTVIIDLEGAPLKSSLRLMLKQLGLAYCIRDGVLIVSSVEGVREELAEAARELLGAGSELVDMRTLARTGIVRNRLMGGGGGMGGMGGGMR